MKNLLNHVASFVGLVVAVLLVAGCQTEKQASCPMSTSACSVSATNCSACVVTSPPTRASQAAMTPQQALAELEAGNARFVAGHPLHRNMQSDVKATASGQYPFAVVLSCIDSRQPIEIVLDQGIGAIFSVRVAGNVLNNDVLGSMEFACKVSGAKLIAVIGHTNCGAIRGAIDDVQLGHLTGLLAKIKPAVEEVPADVEPRTSKNPEFVDAVAKDNVRLVMQQIRGRSPILREMIDKGQIELVGGMYDLSTGKVQFFDK